MDKNIDLLQIKIEKAKGELTEESRNAIEAVDWKKIITKMREEKGYSFTQLEDLETETELLLCGLTNPEDYPKELEKRMGIQKAQVDILVNEMNDKVFKKIREELIKNIERKKTSENKESPQIKNNGSLQIKEELTQHTENPDSLKQKGLPVEIPEIPLTQDNKSKDQFLEKTLKTVQKDVIPSILNQKLSGNFQIPKVVTDHTLLNMTKGSGEEKTKLPKVDPYREIPE